MAIDMEALKRMSEGEPNTKVTVNRRWLAEVHKLLAEKRKAERDAELKRKLDKVFSRLGVDPERLP